MRNRWLDHGRLPFAELNVGPTSSDQSYAQAREVFIKAQTLSEQAADACEQTTDASG